jgi:uncharacterized protein YdbL (DUF1318 family)
MTRSNKVRNGLARLAAAALLMSSSSIAVLAVTSTPAWADVAASKAVIDAAKAQGIVGEQGDGYLGFVASSSDPAIAAALAEINAGRAAVYRDSAAKAGVTPSAAGQAAAQQILARLPPGQYYKPLGGGWMRR